MHLTYEVDSSLNTGVCKPHVHTQLHTYSHSHRLPFKGQCLCQCAGTAGLWYVSGPQPETHTRTGLPQDVKRVWCSSFLILPQTLGRIQDAQHTVAKKPVELDWVTAP